MIENPYLRFIFIEGGEEIAKWGQGDKNVYSSSNRNSNGLFLLLYRGKNATASVHTGFYF